MTTSSYQWTSTLMWKPSRTSCELPSQMPFAWAAASGKHGDAVVAQMTQVYAHMCCADAQLVCMRCGCCSSPAVRISLLVTPASLVLLLLLCHAEPPLWSCMHHAAAWSVLHR